MENRNMFAQRLKQVREEKKMTQKAFSEFLEIKQQTLSGYETDKISPSLEVAAEIAKKLDISLDWLCGNGDTRNLKREFKTCADVIKALYQMDLEVEIKVNDMYFADDSGYEYCIRINHDVFESFLPAWKKMLELFHSQTISRELYDLWINDQIRAYSEKMLNDLPFSRY